MNLIKIDYIYINFHYFILFKIIDFEFDLKTIYYIYLIRKAMSRFLRLTNFLVNVNQIRLIEITPDKYKISLISSEFKGFMLLGSGNINTDNTNIDICKKEHIKDYTIVSDWLLAEKTNNVWR